MIIKLIAENVAFSVVFDEKVFQDIQKHVENSYLNATIY